jgi:hypothetical protein
MVTQDHHSLAEGCPRSLRSLNEIGITWFGEFPSTGNASLAFKIRFRPRLEEFGERNGHACILVAEK